MTDLLGPAFVSARWGYFLSAFLVIGASSFAPIFFGGRFAFPREFPDPHREFQRRAARLGLIGALGLLGFGAARLWLQTRSLLEPGEPVSAEFLRAVLGSDWGTGWKRQAVASLAALPAFLAARRGWASGWLLAIVAALGVTLTAGMTGHAATQDAGPGGWLIDAVHVGAGGVWLGGLGVLMIAGLAACRPLEPVSRGRAHRLLVGHFSRRAQVAAPLTILFGGWLAARYLGWGWPVSFFRSEYGWALAVKVLVVLVVAALGALNWRYVQPRLERPGGGSRLAQFGAVELLFGVLVLGATAVLVALPFSEHGS